LPRRSATGAPPPPGAVGPDARHGLIPAGLVGAVAVLTLIRLIGLQLSVTDLYADEAQYWVWAQSPAWGYFSKPPLVAWLIAAVQPICGSGPACVRTPSVLIWAAIPVIVAAIGTMLGGRKVGLWAGLCALLAPGAAFSARILSTDPPLLLFWSLALLAFLKLRAGASDRWLVVLAAGIGAGLLSKYAMAYFLGGLVIAALIDRPSRQTLQRPAVWLAIAGGLALLLPNLLWNLDHDLVTLRHTGENLADGAEAFALDQALSQGLEFVAAQFGLAGPVVFGALIAAAFKARRLTADQRVLLAFSAPLFIAVTVVAVVNGANGNWAAPGLIAAFVLAPLMLAGRAGRRWLAGGLAFGAIVQGGLLILDARPDRLSLPGQPYGSVMGWSALSGAVSRAAGATGVSMIVAERRGDVAQLTHGLRGQGLLVRAWPAPWPGVPRDYFQMARPLTGANVGPVLAVTECSDVARFRQGWRQVEQIATATVDAGPGATRTYSLIRLDQRIGPVARPPDCPGT
jgi:hypothetical protein